MKIKVRKKRHKYLDLARELRKLWNMRVTLIPVVRVGNRRMNRDHTNNSIVEIDKNTEMSPGDLKRLAVTQTHVKDHRLMLE